MARRKQNAPCIKGMLGINEAIAMLQGTASEKFHVPRSGRESPWCLIAYRDAAQGNAVAENEALQV